MISIPFEDYDNVEVSSIRCYEDPKIYNKLGDLLAFCIACVIFLLLVA